MSRRSVVGFRGEETDKCRREVTLSVRCVVVGLDLVKVQILIPILPLWISHLPLPPVFYERRISPRLTREKRYHSSSSTPRLRFKVDISLLSRPYLSSSPTSLCFILLFFFFLDSANVMSWLSRKALLKDFYPVLIDTLKEKKICCVAYLWVVIKGKKWV